MDSGAPHSKGSLKQVLPESLPLMPLLITFFFFKSVNEIQINLKKSAMADQICLVYVEYLPNKTVQTSSFVASLSGCFCSWMKWPRHNGDIEYPIKMEARSHLNYKLVCQMLILRSYFALKT